MEKLRPFQREWIRKALSPDCQIAALSVARGNGKTALLGWLAAQAMTPGSGLWKERQETLVVAASIEQGRTLVEFAKDDLDLGEYQVSDASNRLHIRHKATNTRLRVLSSDPRRAMGLSRFGLLIGDEPGAWQNRGGEMMFHSLRQALGKREDSKLLLIGTQAPAAASSWWPELLKNGSGPGLHVSLIAADEKEPWDAWQTIRKANPLVAVNPALRRTILRERDEARRNPSLQPSFLAYRLNRLVDVRAEVLVNLADWKAVEARPVPERAGRPILALDLGSTRSWSAAWCLWPSGRSELYALAPGVPDLLKIEKRDSLAAGIYQQLQDSGVLIIDEGVRVSRPAKLIAHLVERGIIPAVVICDSFAVNALRDCVSNHWPVKVRRTKWEQATSDIADFRKLVYDGPLSVAPEGRALAQLGLREIEVRSDDSGSASRLFKARGDRSRDDIVQAGVLAAGLFARSKFGSRVARKPPRLVSIG